MTQTHKTTTLPDHVQVLPLYSYLALRPAEGFPTIDSTKLFFEGKEMEAVLIQQGVAAEDVPAALESLVAQGMMKKGELPVEDPDLHVISGSVPVYSFTHKAAVLYHGMQTD